MKPVFARLALGLHPELAVERHRGLSQSRALQRRVLSSIIEQCDAAGGKVVTVHSRRAAEDVVSAFGERFRGTYILQWYSGGLKALRRAVANGAYFSVNTAMIRSERGKALAAETPRERVLTETDGPFVSVDDKAAEPHRVSGVLEGLAKLWGVTPEEARRIVYKNFSLLLRRPVPDA